MYSYLDRPVLRETGEHLMLKYFLIYGGALTLSLVCLIEGAGGMSLVPIGVVTIVHGVLALIIGYVDCGDE